ncbi:hypothetical protein CFN79_04715 [Chromobacterium vaccinii]|uniref:DUF3079 domain-containing protein n=1 Tax=Chromobacterium vaccinii TaxID=1108595 RepID=UPI000CE9452C|nr:DUF3079 domain-containing protein [Chromobacterium vaccinii]AVG15216.1 hypothetical protein CFN79_04715 [Chromobacterium vaccinii]
MRSSVPGTAKKFPLHPRHPERICWGCDKYCPASDMACGNGSSRTQHPAEIFGDDWFEPDPSADDAGAGREG